MLVYLVVMVPGIVRGRQEETDLVVGGVGDGGVCHRGMEDG